MKTKTIKWIVLVFWPFFFFFCVSYHPRTEPTKNVKISKFYGGRILAAQMRGGDYYRFRDDLPGQVVIDRVVGQAVVAKEFPLDQIKARHYNKNGDIFKFEDVNGVVYWPLTARTVKDKYLAYFADSPSVEVSLPYTDIETLTVIKRGVNPAFAIIVIVVAAAIIWALTNIRPFSPGDFPDF